MKCYKSLETSNPQMWTLWRTEDVDLIPFFFSRGQTVVVAGYRHESSKAIVARLHLRAIGSFGRKHDGIRDERRHQGTANRVGHSIRRQLCQKTR